MADFPPFMQTYLELLNMRARMRESYNEQDQKIKEQINSVEPLVRNYCESRPEKVFETPSFSGDQEARFGKLGTVRIKTEKVSKPLSKDVLFTFLKDYFIKNGKTIEEGEKCAEECWASRPVETKEVVDRTYGASRKRKPDNFVF